MSWRTVLAPAVIGAAATSCNLPFGAPVSAYCPVLGVNSVWGAAGVQDTVTTPARCPLGLREAGQRQDFVNSVYAPYHVHDNTFGNRPTAKVWTRQIIPPVEVGSVDGLWEYHSAQYDKAQMQGFYLAGGAGFNWSRPWDSAAIRVPLTVSAGGTNIATAYAKLEYAQVFIGRITRTPANVFVNDNVLFEASVDPTQLPHPQYTWTVSGQVVPYTGTKYQTRWSTQGTRTVSVKVRSTTTGRTETFSNTVTVLSTRK
jgi:hypothetical protein